MGTGRPDNRGIDTKKPNLFKRLSSINLYSLEIPKQVRYQAALRPDVSCFVAFLRGFVKRKVGRKPIWCSVMGPEGAVLISWNYLKTGTLEWWTESI